MKKNKFLKGMSAAFALALVALATTFTSCEKENFNVDVTLSNATASISPVVLYVDATGNVTDVTSSATISPSVSSMTYTGSPALAAQTVEVTATYNGISATITVSIPALSAGQNVYLTPTILLAEESEPSYSYTTVQYDETTEKPDTYNNYWDNTTDYYWTESETYLSKKGITEAEYEEGTDITEADLTYLETLAGSIPNNPYEEEKTVEFYVWSHSRTTITAWYTIAYVTINVIKTTSEGESTVVGNVTYKNYVSTNIDIEENLTIPGHGHSPAGTGHGHGTDDNAGGGIVVAD